MDNLLTYQQNLINHVISAWTKDIEKKKMKIFQGKVKELGLPFDPAYEGLSRFKNFTLELQDDVETIYFRDGSPQGLRVVSFHFKMIEPDFDGQEFKVGGNLLYW